MLLQIEESAVLLSALGLLFEEEARLFGELAGCTFCEERNREGGEFYLFTGYLRFFSGQQDLQTLPANPFSCFL